MKEKVKFFLACFFVSMLLLVGVPMAADKPAEIKLAHIGGSDATRSLMHAAALSFKAELEARTAGKLKVIVYHSGQLGKEVDLMEAVGSNVIQLNMASLGGLYRIFTPFYLYYTPYAFRNADVAQATIEGPFSEKLFKAFEEKTGLVPLDFLDTGTFAVITNNKRPLFKPEDFKGLKFRGMDQLQIQMFKSLGASGVPIAFSELYTSLQTGVVDGQTNPDFVVEFLKFDEVQKYLTVAYSQYAYQVLICNKKWFKSLSNRDQKAVRAAARAMRKTGQGWGPVLSFLAQEKLQKRGMKINYLNQEQVDALQNLARPACLKWLKTKMDPKWVDEFEEAIKAAEAQAATKYK